VLVASNMFGDIVSDLCAQLVGGLGFACSGNIGDNFAVFEPSHGSAPKYVGMNKVNPIAQILSAKMMLDWLGEKEMATKVEDAIIVVIAEGKVRTYDMGGSSTTSEMVEEICEKLLNT
ncbi:MAG: isocitrate/isopropylmalate dehydrogenase family protein, partial [Candidatus Heimdallarchaeota archaeon]|nr:isocitrate/isopropylmalate dehydrogenase family protein [Candidatus Heimdallarchaeota archaeon]MCK4878916.1 isocitrate/isopropylmalate dehydrogenase family protein [Candidatus Heimdallarchaeota archaeon]